MSNLSDLKKAKQYSDVRQYKQKHDLIRKMVTATPTEFYVDSDKNGITGLTHASTGFRIHVPNRILSGVELASKPSAKASAALTAMPAGFGLPKVTGGGNGTYVKMPSMMGQAKAQLTKATKQVGENAKQDTPGVTDPSKDMFKATRAHYTKTQRQQGKLASIGSTLGYSPGLWYDKDDYSAAGQARFGKLVSGAGLSALGVASVPILKYLFPERFQGKGKALTALAVLGGMAAPWAAGLPSTLADLNGLKNVSNADYTPKMKYDMILRSRQLSGISPSTAETPAAKVSSYIPMDLQIAKTHLADVMAEQLSSGYVDYGQAVGLMNRASRESNKPWVTVRGLARAAIGAGAGGLAGTVAAKGIGLFMNLSPMEQKTMQGTGAALGTLISLGKLGF